ncbi:phage portal protein [Aerococcaceae bacterium WGS1372]
MANFFTKWFSKDKPPQPTSTESYHEAKASFTRWNRSAYENDIFRGAIDSIARHGAKLKPMHVVDGQEGDKRLNILLQKRPNPYMNTYDMLYKVITHYFIYNNAFIYIERDRAGKINAFYPIQGTSVEFGTDNQENMLVRFLFQDGSDVYIPYRDIIHLRRHYNGNQLLGDDNSALNALLEVSHKQNEGIVKSIELGASIRGVVSFSGIANEEVLREKRDRFSKEYLSISNNGGVITLDSKDEYTSIDSKPISIDESQLHAIEDKVYRYLGIHRNIVSSNFTEDEFNSFYESIIEPLANQLSLEFTDKCFTHIELLNGNEVIFDNQDLQFRSNDSKLKYIASLMPMGVLTVNQSLEILNLPTVDDEIGDKRLQTLNYVDMKEANKYQIGDELNERTQDSNDSDRRTE